MKITNTKTYSHRDSATAALRKLGIKARDYNLFIEKSGDKFICHLDRAKNVYGVEKSSSSKASGAPKKSASAKKPAKRTVTSVVREMIFGGLTNAEIWAAIKEEFKLDDKKKSYPAWYRADAKRRGLLSA